MLAPLVNDRVESDLQTDIDAIVSAIRKSGVVYDAIYLVGSFGRGEGSVRFDGIRWHGVNDYDLLVITSKKSRQSVNLKKLGAELAKAIETDFVDIGSMAREDLPQLLPTIANYDLKYASRLITGSDILEEVPHFDAGAIPPFEFARLICNRTAGILSVSSYCSPRSDLYKSNQYLKACIAVGDTAVYLGEGYHPSYRERSKRFKSLIDQARLPFFLTPDAVQTITSAYLTKVKTTQAEIFEIDDSLMQCMIESAYCAVVNQRFHTSVESVAEAGRALIRTHLSRSDWPEKLDAFVRLWLGYDKTNPDVYFQVLFSMPVIYCQPAKPKFWQKLNYFMALWSVPKALSRAWNGNSAVQLWEDHCH